MPTRNGKQYLEGLRDERTVWLGAEKVDVTTHPALQGSLGGMAGYFDWQQQHAEDCLVPDPATGQPMSASLIVSRTAADLAAPWERVFIDGDLDVYSGLMMHGWAANIMQQTCIRAAVKLEFAYDLCTRMAQAAKSDGRPDTAQMLGEIWGYATLTRAGIQAAEDGAHDWGNGAFFCDDKPLRALRSIRPAWMARTNEIIKLIGSHNLLATASLDAFDNPGFAPNMRGAGGMGARERAKLFRTAWDFAGSALGGRVELYERSYLASAPRNLALDHRFAQAQQEWTGYEDLQKAIAGVAGV